MGRGSETQLQVGENFNKITLHLKGCSTIQSIRRFFRERDQYSDFCPGIFVSMGSTPDAGHDSTFNTTHHSCDPAWPFKR